MTDYYPRNWEGCGSRRPTVAWPDQKTLAINIVINLEEGAERNVLDDDDCSENRFSGFPPLPSIAGRHYSSESLYAYGSRAGSWRLLQLLNHFDIPATFFACGQALERNPSLADALHDSDHEVAGHGLRWIDYSKLDEDTERQHIQQTLNIIQSTTGKTATGWYTGLKSPHTRRLLIEAGLKYDSDDYSDDHPFWLPVEDRRHLVIPYTLINNDIQYCLPAGWSCPENAYHHLKMTFDALYRESKCQPATMTIGLHCRLSGQPGRSEAIRHFIEYAQAHQDIWFTTRANIARCYYEQSPA